MPRTPLPSYRFFARTPTGRQERSMQMFDLSVTLGEGMDVYPGDPPFSAVLASRFDQNGYNLLNLTMGAHTGTHIDLPRHFLRDGYCITDVPPERFAAPAVFIDVSRQVR